ncbi:PREDICTED: histone acetyltransferase HAC4-like [Camelina sativa]|uniref:histone acetyltransferase n=1 Tax=Camelina sativa TaxID=90675 RepID=A0ABM0X5U8_CAMSA|nr:PREDICTED: histone acetyltransferase HAC4-like [Camelina sativa]
MNNNVSQSTVAVPAPNVCPVQEKTRKYRNITRAKIYSFLVRKITSAAGTNAVTDHQKTLAVTLENLIFKDAKTWKDYTNPNTLEARIYKHLGLNFRPAAATTSTTPCSSVAMMMNATPSPHSLGMMNGGALGTCTSTTFQPGSMPPQINCTSGVSAGFSIGPDMQMHQYSAGASNFNQQMMDMYRPNVNLFTSGMSTPLMTGGVGFSRNYVPLPNGPITSQDLLNATHLSTLSQPFLQPLDQSHMHDGIYSSMSNAGSFGPSNPSLYPYPYPCGVVTSSGSMAVSQNSVPWNPNPMLQGVDATVTSNHSNLQGMQQTPLPKRQLHHPLWNNNQDELAQASQQVLSHGFHPQARDIDPQLGQHPQKIYPVQLQKQDPLLDKDAYLTQQAMGTLAAAPVITGPSKEVNGDCGQTYLNERRWLTYMLHVRKCKARKGKCVSKFCFEAKKMWKHISCCKVPDCTYRYCLPTRKLLHHYNECGKKSCPLCGPVKSYYEKNKDTSVPLRKAKCSKRQPKKSSTSKKPNKKRVAEASTVDADLKPSMKRLKLQRPPSQNATPETGCAVVVCKPDPSMSMPMDKDALKPDKTDQVMPMDMDVPKTCGIPVTRELEKLVSEDTPKGKDCGVFTKDEKTSCLLEQAKPKCMKNEVISASKEQNVKQSVDVANASKMEISSLVELFTPEQVKGHIRSLRQWVGQSKTKAEKNKAMGCSMSVNSCQLCAVERLVFEPIPIYCSPCGVRIKKNALHYSVAAGESKHCVCAPCYNEARENLVSLDGTCIPKAKLEKKKNDEQVGEGWVQCDKCEAWQHQICALFNSRRNHGEATKYTCPNCYIQEVERGERRPLPPSAIPGANKLPVTALSNHIEERLFKKLKEERQERASLQGKSFQEVPGAESLTVRVVASVDRVLEVKERFLEIFREDNYPSEFPYKSKVILLFQKIENVEVCLFGMFVQEFGTKSGPPNQRRVYLSYLDSVKYFRPEVRTVSGEALRTFVYHEILIGYLDYCKKRGFTSCYIWACPPLKGEDYILYCHPEIQKTPKTDKLREWYLAMLRKASKEGVVVECTNLYDHFFVQSGECRATVTAARLPYFDGDYWPGAAEDLIRQMSQEDDGTNLNRKGSTKNVISKRALRAFGQLDLSANASKDRLMMQKLGETICPMKEDFIMVHLQHCCKHCTTLMVSGNRWVCNQCKNFQICDKCNEVEQNRIDKERHPINQKEKHSLFPVVIEDVPVEIKDKDDNLESEFFDNRQAFLNLCQGNNYQYDTLRRAKHSSMMILYHLHNPTAPAFATFCSNCQQEIESSQGWHCEVCPSYDVCSACYSKAPTNHEHKLISRSSSADTSVVQHTGKSNHSYLANLEKFKEVLVHATACRSKTLCQYQGCRMMKNLFRHCLACKAGFADCPYCMRFWITVKNHARSCRDSQCTVPKCRDLRANFSRQQQQSDKRRRAAVMEMMRERAAEATRTG